MSNINPAAETAREQARQTDGRFGEQHKTDPGQLHLGEPAATVGTQSELEAVLADETTTHINIDSPKGVWLQVNSNGPGDATITVRGESTVQVWGDSTVEARDTATVDACDSSTVKAHDSSFVRAWSSATVEAHDSSLVIIESSHASVHTHSPTATISGRNTTIQKTRNAHAPGNPNHHGTQCQHCGNPYPCPTIQALDTQT